MHRHLSHLIVPYLRALTLIILLPVCLSVIAQQDPVFNSQNGAIRGYDPVAYFTQAEPVKGLPELTHIYHGATWHFASEKNRELFIADPEKFAPAYGGYCAFGLTKGHLVPIDPAAWTIHEGRLYLNYSQGVRNQWQQDIPANLKLSDQNWSEQAFNH